MTKIKVYSIYKSPYLTSRAMASRLQKYSSQETIFDFNKINFVSAAFADELLKQTKSDRVINARENVKEIFKAVRGRQT